MAQFAAVEGVENLAPLSGSAVTGHPEPSRGSGEPVDGPGRTLTKKKPWRYRWPDDIRDEVLARLLALNAERHQEEVRLGIAPGMKAAKKKVAAKKAPKKTAPQKIPATAPPEVLPFLSGLQDHPWESAITALPISVPTTCRISAESPLAYYRLLIPAMVQEAGGSIPLDLFYDAVIQLEDRKSLINLVLGLSKSDATRWDRQFCDTVDAAAFGSALRSLAVDGHRVRIVGSKDQLELRAFLTEPITLEWILADARLALKAALAKDAAQRSGPPSELKHELSLLTKVA